MKSSSRTRTSKGASLREIRRVLDAGRRIYQFYAGTIWYIEPTSKLVMKTAIVSLFAMLLASASYRTQERFRSSLVMHGRTIIRKKQKHFLPMKGQGLFGPEKLGLSLKKA